MIPIRNIVEVDLRRHVGRDGLMAESARMAVFHTLAELPPGSLVRLHIGRATWLPEATLSALAENLYDAAALEVVGSHTRGHRCVTDGVRRLLLDVEASAA